MMWNVTSFMNMIARTFGMIATCRMIFGLFSAFCTPVAYSMIADTFPPERRTIANALFTASSFLGIAISNLAVVLIGSVGWRATYGYCGVYGLFAASFFVMFVKEPQRGRFEAKKEAII